MKFEFFFSATLIASAGYASPTAGDATRLAECRLTDAEADAASKALVSAGSDDGKLDASNTKLFGFQATGFVHRQVPNKRGEIENHYVVQVTADFEAVKVAALRGAKQTACVGEYKNSAGLRSCVMNPPVVNRAPAIMEIVEKPDHIEISCVYVP